MKAKPFRICRTKPIPFFVFAMIITSVFLFQACGPIKAWLYQDYSVEQIPIGQIDEQCVSAPNTGQIFTPEQTKACIISRNSKVFRLLKDSDDRCEEHLKKIYGNEAMYNLIFGTATSIFSGLGVVFADPATKTVMSASALFSNAERSLINETVYKTLIVSSIVKKIRDDREKRRTAIINCLKDPSVPYIKFPINVAVADIQDYHNHCSFMYGLQKALEEGTQDTTAQRIVQLKRDLDEVELKMKSRAADLGNKPLATETINGDYLLTQLKDRHDALNKELTLLESLKTPSAQTASAPDAPTEVSAKAGPGQGEATVSFKAPASDGGSSITSYTVTSNPGNLAVPGLPSGTVVKGLTKDITYTFTVTANNVVGTSPASKTSEPVKITTAQTASAQPSVPAAPTDVIAEPGPGDGEVTVSFKAPSSDGGSPITSYAVSSNPGNLAVPGLPSGTVVKGLTKDITYTFTVTANNVVGTSPASSPSSGVKAK